jgi:hypothetical protein
VISLRHVLRGRESDPAAALSGSQSKTPGFAGGYLLHNPTAVDVQGLTGHTIAPPGSQEDANASDINGSEAPSNILQLEHGIGLLRS